MLSLALVTALEILMLSLAMLIELEDIDVITAKDIISSITYSKRY